MKLADKLVCTIVVFGFAGFGLTAQTGRPEVSQALKHDLSPPLRELQSAPRSDTPRERPLRTIPLGPAANQRDPVVQTAAGPLVSTTSGLSFAGVGNGDYGFVPNAAPPDTEGAVGATQYVQWVNESCAVFDKATGAIAAGFPKAGNTIWAGFGGGCETNNDGDPIVQYDKLANRWVFTQFSVSTLPYLQCVAVSTTSDATGTYNRYAFTYGSTQFPDYPKLGVWPDAYYISFNIFNNGVSFAGAKVCAYDRNSMLNGAAATQQCFQLSTSFGGLLPSDLDGPASPPAAGTPGFFLNFGTNSLNLWKFHVDWVTTANTTLTGPINIPVAAFSPACNGGTCIPQLGTSQKLDSLADRLMYRLAYRRFSDGHESLLVNHSVATGSGNVGVRWYELRNPAGSTVAAGTPFVYQQSTYAPDSNFRWMGSIAMDQSGGIALGYSISSTGINPSIRFTGRAATDPLGTMQAENVIRTGSGSQLPNLSRWGDYSAMTVDPVDDCTFWYTNEYLKASGTFNWSTWINSFKLPGCGVTSPPSAPTLSATPGIGQVSLSWTTAAGATSYNVLRSTSSGQESPLVTVTSTNYIDTAVIGGTLYYYVVQAVNSAGTSPNSNEVTATPTCTTPAAPSGLAATAVNAQVSLSWSGSAGAASYKVYRGTSSGGEAFLITVATTSFTDTGLTNGTTYFYKVTAVNSCNVESGPSNEASATPAAAAVPPAPTALTATSGPGAKQISLAWAASAGATGYNVKLSTTSGGPYTIIATGVTTTSFTNTGLVRGATYYYVVSAVNAAGESPNSNQASATAR